MNPVALSLADGTTFFVGLALVVSAEALLIRFRNQRARPVLTVLTIVGIVLVVASATPLPLWAYLSWTILAFAGLYFLNRAASSQKSQIVACSSLFVLTLGLCVVEAPHHRLPKITIPDGTIVYVLGDSISAGMETNLRCWPEVLEEMIPFRVINLAQAGATAESAIVQAQGIMESHSLVIVEIGGNDLLGGTESSVFRSNLETLIFSLSSDQHQVLVVELPLFPFQNAFGKAQRSIAAKHGATMLPKRCFTRVLGTENGTIDGLHLSQEGHDAMAGIMAGVICQR